MTSRFTPADHVIDPDCPLPETVGHGYRTAHRRGCACPGPSLEDYRQFKADEWARRKDSDRRLLPRDDKHEARFPAVPVAPDLDQETRMVLNSDEPACADVDPEAFFPVGTNAFAQEQTAYAKSVCAGCGIRAACLRQALAWNAVGVWGGTTDTERRHMRARGLREAVAA